MSKLVIGDRIQWSRKWESNAFAKSINRKLLTYLFFGLLASLLYSLIWFVIARR